MLRVKRKQFNLSKFCPRMEKPINVDGSGDWRERGSAVEMQRLMSIINVRALVFVAFCVIVLLSTI